MFINTNVASLNSQRQLAGSTGLLATATQRLSSGLRINSAKDDAAGLAISERMTAQVKGLDQARRNANDGISLAQTAEGALAEVGNNLQRMRELAVQAANSTNKSGDRSTIQSEINQLRDEIQRMTDQTTFNGNKLLDGTYAGKTFQVGADAGQMITIQNVGNTNVAELGKNTKIGQIGATTLGAVGAASMAASKGSLGSGTITIAYTQLNDDGTTTAATQVITIGQAASASERQAQVVAGINKYSEKTGVTAALDGGKISLTSTDANGAVKTAEQAITSNLSAAALGFASSGVTFEAATNLNVGALTVTGATSDNATKAIRILDEAIKEVNKYRSDLGGIQNRFSSAITSLQTSSENISASRSRIKDADFASESAALARANVLQQAGTAMLAQANQQPQQALQLLR